MTGPKGGVHLSVINDKNEVVDYVFVQLETIRMLHDFIITEN